MNKLPFISKITRYKHLPFILIFQQVGFTVDTIPYHIHHITHNITEMQFLMEIAQTNANKIHRQSIIHELDNWFPVHVYVIGLCEFRMNAKVQNFIPSAD